MKHRTSAGTQAGRGKQAPLNLSPVAALMAGLFVFGAGSVYAADAPTVEELQQEVARLKAELAARDKAAADAAAAANGTAPVAAPVEAAPEATAEADGKTQELEKVVIRSRPKLARVADVPQSISVLSGKDLESQLALDIGAISQRSASLVKNVGNSRTFSLSLRGVGKVTQTEAQDVSVGAVVDGVSIVYAPFVSFNFYDVDTVEVAKGPQGTLQGKNFTLGSVSVNTRNPSFTPDASWSLALGQNQTVIGQLAGGGTVVDDLLAWRGALIAEKGNGPFTNNYNADNSYFNKDRVSGRVKLLFTPTSDFSALASVEIQPNGAEFYNSGTVKINPPANYANTGNSTNNTTLDIYGKLNRDWFLRQNGGQNFYNSGLYLNNPNPTVNDQLPLYTYTNNWSLQLKKNFENFDVTSITAGRRYHFGASNDEGTPYAVSMNGGGKVEEYKQLSQEFRLSSKPGGKLDWQTGFLYFQNSVKYGLQSLNAGWGQDAGAWFANDTQYGLLDTDSAGRQLLTDSVNGMGKSSSQNITNRSKAIFGQTDWHVTDLFTLTTGARLTYENRTNETASQIVNNGVGGALNPVTVRSVQLGGFNSVALTQVVNGQTVVRADAGQLVANGNSAAQLALADQVAQRYFGVSSYASLTPAQRTQVAAAKGIRSTQIGTIWNPISGPAFRKAYPGFTVSPSYKFNADQTGYFAVQYGQKGGVSQVVNGNPQLASPEKATSIELGLKSVLFNKDLTLNADVFNTDIRNYQQTVNVLDPLNPASTISYVGNAPKVSVRGFEFDGAYSGIRNLTARFSGAYTLARYDYFPNAPVPAEYETGTGLAGSRDVSGRTLPGASRYTLNIGAEYRVPVFKQLAAHGSFNSAFQSGYFSDANLSAYSWIPKHWTTDAAIGIGRSDQKFDVSLIVKNLFNDDTPQNQTLNTYIPAIPRWFGIQFSGKM